MIKSLQKNFDELKALRNDVLKELQTLSETQRTFKPNATTWSINQVLEHLYLSETATEGFIKKKTSGEDKLYQATFKHTWRTFLLKLYLRSSKKFKVPPKAPVEPSGNISFAEITKRWDLLHNDFAVLLNNFDEETANKLIFKHPVAGYFNANQTIRFCYEHIHHHIRQIEALKTQVKDV